MATAAAPPPPEIIEIQDSDDDDAPEVIEIVDSSDAEDATPAKRRRDDDAADDAASLALARSLQSDDDAPTPAKDADAASLALARSLQSDPKRRRRDDGDAASLALARSLQAEEDDRARRGGPEAAVGGATCAICLCEVDAADGVRLRACGHEVHRECGARLVAAADRAGAKCPDCRAPLHPHDVRDVGGRDAASKSLRFSLDRAVDAAPDLFRCPTADCPFLCVWDGGGPPRLDCRMCRASSCLVCGRAWHEGSCEAAADQTDEERATLAYVREAGIRRCARCGNGVVKSEGCDKMRCRCGYEFCYRCGAKGARCGCTPSHHVAWDNNRRRPAMPSWMRGRGRPPW